MITRLEQIECIQEDLKTSGFGIGVAHKKKGFWIYRKDTEKVYASTEDFNTKLLDQKYPLCLYLRLPNEEPSNSNNLDYIRKTLDLKRILDAHQISYEIPDLDKIRDLVSQNYEKLKSIVPQLKEI